MSAVSTNFSRPRSLSYHDDSSGETLVSTTMSTSACACSQCMRPPATPHEEGDNHHRSISSSSESSDQGASSTRSSLGDDVRHEEIRNTLTQSSIFERRFPEDEDTMMPPPAAAARDLEPPYVRDARSEADILRRIGFASSERGTQQSSSYIDDQAAARRNSGCSFEDGRPVLSRSDTGSSTCSSCSSCSIEEMDALQQTIMEAESSSSILTRLRFAVHRSNGYELPRHHMHHDQHLGDDDDDDSEQEEEDDNARPANSIAAVTTTAIPTNSGSIWNLKKSLAAGKNVFRTAWGASRRYYLVEGHPHGGDITSTNTRTPPDHHRRHQDRLDY